MTSAKEILPMLVKKLDGYVHSEALKDHTNIYLNEYLGDSSFLIAGLVYAVLMEKFEEWNGDKWIDDSLIKKVKNENGEIHIEGHMIWGREQTTQQWVDPFYLIIDRRPGTVGETGFRFAFMNRSADSPTYEDYVNKMGRELSDDADWKYTCWSNGGEIYCSGR